MNLTIDLSEHATRSFLLDTVVANLPKEKREEVLSLGGGSLLESTHYRDLPAVLAAIGSCPLSDRVKADAKAIYRLLAQAEAHVHGCSVEETHFHEVGEAESISSVLAICRAIELMDPQEIHATPVQVGFGTVTCAHGELDIPAPATRALLERGIPTAVRRLEGERCTPTSAAVILHFVDAYDIPETR